MSWREGVPVKRLRAAIVTFGRILSLSCPRHQDGQRLRVMRVYDLIMVSNSLFM